MHNKILMLKSIRNQQKEAHGIILLHKKQMNRKDNNFMTMFSYKINLVQLKMIYISMYRSFIMMTSRKSVIIPIKNQIIDFD